MILFRARHQEHVHTVIEDIEAVEDLSHLDLMEMQMLDLAELVPESIEWSMGEPIVFNEDDGLLLVEFSEDAVDWLMNNHEFLKKFGINFLELEKFSQIREGKLYCLDTF